MAGEDRWHSSLLSPATLGGNIAGTIALPHRPHWFPFGFVRRAKEQAAAAKAITALGIRCGSSDDTMDLLSGGNQQKVVVGRWQAEPCHSLAAMRCSSSTPISLLNAIAAVEGAQIEATERFAA
jgi:simple sugar transport system ATP-binding protein